jgi:hypothetical protein
MAATIWCLSRSLVQGKGIAGRSDKGVVRQQRSKLEQVVSWSAQSAHTSDQTSPRSMLLSLSCSGVRCLRSNFRQPQSSDIERHTGVACRRRRCRSSAHERFEYSFKQRCHLLIAVEQGVRYDGETFVEGLPTSTIRNYSHKLTPTDYRRGLE